MLEPVLIAVVAWGAPALPALLGSASLVVQQMALWAAVVVVVLMLVHHQLERMALQQLAVMAATVPEGLVVVRALRLQQPLLTEQQVAVVVVDARLWLTMLERMAVIKRFGQPQLAERMVQAVAVAVAAGPRLLAVAARVVQERAAAAALV